MGPLNYDSKLPVDEKNKKLKLKSLKMYNIISFRTIRYNLAASGNFIHSILNCKLMRPVNILRLPKQKTGKNINFKKIEREYCRRH